MIEGQKSPSIKVVRMSIFNRSYKPIGIKELLNMGNGEYWEVIPNPDGTVNIKGYGVIDTPIGLLNEGA